MFSCSSAFNRRISVTAGRNLPKPPFEFSPDVRVRAKSEPHIFGIGAGAGHRPDAPNRKRRGQAGERTEGDRGGVAVQALGRQRMGPDQGVDRLERGSTGPDLIIQGR